MKNLLLLFFLTSSFTVFADTTGYYVWVQKASFPPLARHRSIGFSIGDKGYIGLGHVNAGGVTIAYSDFWEYDRATNTWTQKANFAGGNRYAAIGFSIGNKGYAGCGLSSSFSQFNDWWEYNPIANTWTQKAPVPGPPREGGSGFSINGKGYAGLGYYSDWYEYDPVTDVWTPKTSMPGTPQYAPSFVIDTLGYVCTGEYNFPSPLWAYSPATNSWSMKAMFPGGSRFGACAFSFNQKGFVGLGCDYGYNDFKDFYQYNPVTDSWDTLADFPGSRRHYVPGFNIGNKGYCGTGTNGTNLSDFWEFYYYIPQIDTTGIEVLQELNGKSAVNIFPNPISTSATIQVAVTPVDFELFEVSGKKVFAKRNISNTFHFERKDLLSGIYFYAVTLHGNRIQTGKIVLL